MRHLWMIFGDMTIRYAQSTGEHFQRYELDWNASQRWQTHSSARESGESGCEVKKC